MDLDAVEVLERLAALRDKGVLTDAEFKIQRDVLLEKYRVSSADSRGQVPSRRVDFYALECRGTDASESATDRLVINRPSEWFLPLLIGAAKQEGWKIRRIDVNGSELCVAARAPLWKNNGTRVLWCLSQPEAFHTEVAGLWGSAHIASDRTLSRQERLGSHRELADRLRESLVAQEGADATHGILDPRRHLKGKGDLWNVRVTADGDRVVRVVAPLSRLRTNGALNAAAALKLGRFRFAIESYDFRVQSL